MLVSVAHRDFTDSFGEAKAIAKHLAAHSDSDSQLVRELSATHGTGFGLVASPKEVEEGTVDCPHHGRDDAHDEGTRRTRGLPRARARHREGGRRSQGWRTKEEETAAIAKITAALG